MIRGGMLCRYCTRGKCNDISTKENLLEIECPSCNGLGCNECSKDGTFAIDGCPNAFCRSIVNSIDLIDMLGKGMPPVAGGMLDQSVSFIHAAHFFEQEERKVANERSSRNTY
jgi:hypothetical protein